MKNLSFSFIVFLFTYAAQTQPVVITDSQKVIYIARYSSFFEDPEGKLSINDVLKKESAGEFKKITKNVINFGITGSAFWIKSEIENRINGELILEPRNPTLTDIQLFQIDSLGRITKHHSGNWQSFKQRQTKDIDFQFHLNIPNHSSGKFFLRVQNFRGTHFPLLAGTKDAFFNKSNTRRLIDGIYYGIMIIMLLFNLFIFFSTRDISYIYYVLYILTIAFWNATITGYGFKYIWPDAPQLNQYADITACLLGVSSILFATNFLNTRRNTPKFHKLFIALLISFIILTGIILSGSFLISAYILDVLAISVIACFFIAAIIILRKGYTPAKFFLIAWTFLMLGAVTYILKDLTILPYNTITANTMQIGSALEALLLSLALANRINIYKKEKEVANEKAFRSLEENDKLIKQQNVLLEKKVAERTQELKQANRELLTAIQNLKETQTQLVLTEKIASLGQLTAGIAHEIQNPLNFVTNFSEVSVDMVNELKETSLNKLPESDKLEAEQLTANLSENLQKIIHHGKRADAIVKNMLQHSRIVRGEKEFTDINNLTEEYLHLSYNGIRAKDKNFNAEIITNFGDGIPMLNIVPQDIGRVLLNLFNNAFYSVCEKNKKAQKEQIHDGKSYTPTITVNTNKTDNTIQILIHDNGMGIPQKAVDKIFQPFFTTKPAGEGTGLGLSLSYDIITKVHDGTLEVKSKEYEYAEFIISIPFNNIKVLK